MRLAYRHRALYAAFDRFPAPKGAAVHIGQMADALFHYAGGGLLYVLGGDGLPPYQREEQVEIVRYESAEPNRLRRALGFGARLAAVAGDQVAALRLVHFRDPWAGRPLLERIGPHTPAIYEINGLPSIELPTVYPNLPLTTVEKLRAAERACWERADRLVVPARALAANLVRLGAPADKIVVIPNGADPLAERPPRPAGAPARYLLYFGALQPWQGVDVLIRGLARLADLPDLALVIAAGTAPRTTRPLRRLAERLGCAGRVIWLDRLSPSALTAWVAHATLTVAPLTESARNLDQGCCPLKVLESMAAGVPVVASDVPSIREIVTDGVEGRLVPAGRPAELALAIRVLLEYPARLAAMGQRGRERIEGGFTWAHARARLTSLYAELAPDLAAG